MNPFFLFYLSANPNKIKTELVNLDIAFVFYLSANPNKIKTELQMPMENTLFYLSANPNKIKTKFRNRNNKSRFIYLPTLIK